MPAPQYRYFILTIPGTLWVPPQSLEVLPGVAYLKGQKEMGATGYEHWQVIAYYDKKITTTGAKSRFPNGCHIEPTRSSAAEEYVWKDETKIANSEFQLGTKSFKRNSKKDWKLILDNAKAGNFDAIPEDVQIRSYSTLCKIAVDYAQPVLRTPQRVIVVWGPSGTGKSRWAFDNAGDDYYIKAPLTKWWDGYRGQKTIIVDEFRGVIDVSHFLKWCDRYPCAVEKKGSQVYLNTFNWIFTSNLHPKDWWPTLDCATLDAVLRRCTLIIHKLNAFEVMMGITNL